MRSVILFNKRICMSVCMYANVLDQPIKTSLSSILMSLFDQYIDRDYRKIREAICERDAQSFT